MDLERALLEDAPYFIYALSTLEEVDIYAPIVADYSGGFVVSRTACGPMRV
jgi:hypothetical protein